MRTATFPPIRVEPEMRARTESLLREGETLTQFIEDAVRKEVAWRAAQAEFVARGAAALEDYLQHGGPTLEEMFEHLRRGAAEGTERIRAEIRSRERRG